MPCRRPDEIIEGATVDLRRYFTNLLSSLARNRCPACREIHVQLRVKSLSSLPRNPCPAWCEIRTIVTPAVVARVMASHGSVMHSHATADQPAMTTLQVSHAED